MATKVVPIYLQHPVCTLYVCTSCCYVVMSWTKVPDPVLQPPGSEYAPRYPPSAAEDPSQMLVTWSTGENVGSEVYYGEKRPETRALGNATRFVDGGVLKRPQYIHRATMASLKPNTTYGECHISTASVAELSVSVCEYHISRSAPNQSVIATSVGHCHISRSAPHQSVIATSVGHCHISRSLPHQSVSVCVCLLARERILARGWEIGNIVSS